MCWSWSTRICFVSYSNRPIKVDLPSSTEPHVTSRSSSVSIICSEVTDTFAVLHRRLAEPVVRPRLAALGHARRRDLCDHRLQRARLRDDAARARHVADRPEAHRRDERLLVLVALDELRCRVEHAVATEHLAFV